MSPKNSTLTAEHLRALFEYSPETGIFTRRFDFHYRWKAGTTVGWQYKNGYMAMIVDGVSYLVHRLAWLYMTGKFPEKFIDHIDGNRSNNRFVNLREATVSINMQNQTSAKSHNKTGFLGVSPHGSGFRAQIAIDGIRHQLGTYRTPEKAYEVYVEAKRRLHPGNTL